MAMNYNGYWGNRFNNQYMQQFQPPQPTQTPQVQQTFKLIPISNKSETNAVIADLNGTPLYFHNLSNNEIYIKQVDTQTGIALFKEFKEVEPVKDTEQKENKAEVWNKENFDTLNDKLDSLQKTFDDYIKAEKQEVKGNKNAK